MEAALDVPAVDIRTRIPDEAIKSVIRQIANKFNPKLIILFGSYAYGQPRPESDVDLLVVMETSLSETEQAVQICQQTQYRFGLDLVVYTPQRLAQRLAWGDSFLKEITSKGKLVYDYL